MSDTAPEPPAQRLSRFVTRNRIYFKLGALFVVIVVLSISLGLIESVISERRMRQNAAIAEISSAWGAEQLLSGPVLKIPYSYTKSYQREWGLDEVTKDAEAFLLPDRLEISAVLAPEVRYRGIFEAIVYRARLRVSGSFAPKDVQDLGPTVQNVLWDKAVLAVGVSDLRGTGGTPRLTWAGAEVPFVPGSAGVPMNSGMHAPAPLSEAAGAAVDFAFELELAGSQALRFMPAGKTTTARISGPWPHPSFSGAYLPASRRVDADGFQADWTISYLGRNFPQSWTSLASQGKSPADFFKSSGFGVRLIRPVDAYRLSERSVKYGILLIVLIFAAIFIFEVVAPLRVHPIQYGLVGCALSIFYLLLISLAEVIGFTFAYLLAAGLALGLIGFYVSRVLAGRRRALGLTAILGAVYGIIFVILQLEAYALLAGALGLFVALAALMYVTRKIDWYAVRLGGD